MLQLLKTFKPMKKTILTLTGLLLGLLIPLSVQALSFSEFRGGGVSSFLSSFETTENSVQVDPIVTPTTNTGNGACSEVVHEHWHTNTSVNTSSRYFRAAVFSTAIVLDDDFMANIDTTNMVCSNGDSIGVNCSIGSNPLGTVLYNSNTDTTNTDTWHGTTITYQTLDWIAGDPVGLVWRYGQDDTTDLTLLPWLSPGHSKEEDVLFVPENFDHVQTATTESWTKLEFFYIDPAVYNDSNGDGNGEGSYSLSDFHQIYPDTVSSDGTTDEAGVDPDGDYIYWYGINDIEETAWEVCGVAPITCSSLSITPTTGDLGVSDVFNNVPFTVTATGSDGSDITGDSTFTYYLNKFGSGDTDADADGLLKYGFNIFGRSTPATTTDSTVTFNDTEPGDSLYVYVSDYDGNPYPDCNARVELPYCTDLNMDPSGAILYSSSSFNTDITVTASASSGESWPYSITYDSTDDAATYDGNSDPYTTNDYTVTDYESVSTGSERLSVGLDDENGDGESDDVAGLCDDSFTYAYYPSRNECRDLTITTPSTTVSAADMEAGSVEITWTSTMTDGTPTLPPYTCRSSNSSGTFVDSTGATGTSPYSTNQTTVYYTGSAGDTVTCSSALYPICTDTITSETGGGEVYSCTDTTLSEPYIVESDGSHTTLDLTNDADVTTLFNNTTVCYDFSVLVSDPAFSDTLIAAGYEDSTRAAYSGNLQLTVNETGASVVGNPASTPVTGYTTYTGSLCWENYQAGNYIDLQVLGSPLACYVNAELPTPTPPTSSYACTDLTLSPDSVTLSATATDAGTLSVVVGVTADDTAWTGTLMVTKSGSGTLYYTDGSTSDPAGDGHLEIPVSGTTTSVSLTYVGGHSGDIVTAYINGETAACSDTFTITQETTTTSGGGGDTSGGGGDTSGGSGTSGGTESCVVDVNCTNDQLQVCTQGEDVTVVNSENNYLCYYLDENGNGNQDSDEDLTCTTGDIDLTDNNSCYEVTANNICSDVPLTVEENGMTCYDITPNVELGTFSKFIYTFNFSAEKNSYSDQGIFFAHDEDRAFYTLEYTPSGSENQIVFNDDMWTHGYIEAADHGTVDLATTYDELTGGHAYTYTTITHMGFGQRRDGVWLEENSGDLAAYLDDLGTSVPSFLPYIKYDNGSQSSPIEACADTNGDGIVDDSDVNTDVCYDPSETPEGTHSVVIENAGTVMDGTIRIRYVGVVNSNLKCNDTTSTDTCLTEQFNNTATVWDSSDSSNTLDAQASLVVLCSYLLTENAGDVYLNEAIQGGSDLACINVESSGGTDYSGYSNTEGLIISPDTSISSTSTGPTAYYAAETISVCDSSSDGSLIGNLSSYVCEIVTSVTDLWKMSSVETTTESHVSQAIRNASTNQVAGNSTYTNWDQLVNALTNINNRDSHILYFNGDLSTAGVMTLGSITVPCGAWTIIVENATLDIAGDISYATSCSDSSNINQNMPSIAFVVQGGDINFETSSYHNVGVYYTNQDLTGVERSPVNGQLTVDGSLYGNVQPLINACRYVAPPNTEGGGLVVRYDSRILLNTPPSLSEYVDVSTEKGIN